MCNNKFLYFFYFSGISFTGAPSLGKMMFKRMATKAATTTAELPNREFIHVGRPAISPSTWAIMITSSSPFFLSTSWKKGSSLACTRVPVAIRVISHTHHQLPQTLPVALRAPPKSTAMAPSRPTQCPCNCRDPCPLLWRRTGSGNFRPGRWLLLNQRNPGWSSPWR